MSSKKRFRKAFVHIGLGKTGSTTIQKAMFNSGELLEGKHDLHYPRTFKDRRPFHGNHSYLLSSLFGLDPLKAKVNIVSGINNTKKLAAVNSRLRRDFELGFSNSSASKLLISAEAIVGFPRSSLQSLFDWLDLYAEEIVVIACLRHPVNALPSLIQERVKHGHTLEDLYEKPPYHPFRFLFDRLSKVFGAGSIQAYDFSEAIRYDGGIVSAFMAQLGFDNHLISGTEKVANHSMSHEAALILSALNFQRPLLEGNKLGRNRTPQDVALFAGIPGRKYQAPNFVYNKLRALISPDLDWLEKHHQLKLEETPLPPSANYRDFSEEAINQLALYVSDLAVERKI